MRKRRNLFPRVENFELWELVLCFDSVKISAGEIQMKVFSRNALQGS